ncbi:MAG: hypothetical protein WC234_04520 [Endomicrobiaceae bacterium]
MFSFLKVFTSLPGTSPSSFGTRSFSPTSPIISKPPCDVLTTVLALINFVNSLEEETESFYNEYITDKQKRYEQEKLKAKLSQEKAKLKELYPQIDLSEIENLEKQNEYLKALTLISKIKIQKAKETNDQKIAEEAKELVQLLKSIRQESKQLNN